jgi:hypothetical protein
VLAPHDPPGWGRESARRTHVVTVNTSPDEVAPGGTWPEPLTRLHDVQISTRPAPAGRGTEVAVTGEDHDAIRLALRDVKMLLEAGEILQPTRPGTAQPTPLNAPLRKVDEHAREEGRL